MGAGKVCNEEVCSSVGNVMKDVTMKQLSLSLTKGVFEAKQKECKYLVRKIFQDLSKWASETEERLLRQVEEISERRRREMEEISSSLITLPSQLCRHLESSTKARSPTELESVASEVKKIQKDADDLYPKGMADSLVVLEFHLSHLAKNLFLDGETDDFFRVNSCLKPEQILVSSASGSIEGEINIVLEVSPNFPGGFPKFLLSEMNLSIAGSDQITKACVSLKTLYVQKKISFQSKDRVLKISFTIKDLDDRSFANITLSRYCIKNSPVMLRPAVWGRVGGDVNITRTGKPIEDLDESDLISMGYKYSDKSVIQNGITDMKKKNSRSLLENGVTPRVLSTSEKSLIRLNPTPNVTPAESVLDGQKIPHDLDGEEENMDPNSETLIDKGQHPLSSTIRGSQSPIGKHKPDGVCNIGSPFTDRNVINLPLDQPSPLNMNNQKQKRLEDDDGAGSSESHDTTPCTSTQNNLSDRLKLISFPKSDDEEEEEKEASDLKKQGMENLVRIQKFLTGEIPSSQAMEESKHDKSVSFHPNTTIMEPAPNRTRRVSVTSNVNVMDLLPEGKEANHIGEESSICLEDVTDRSSVEEMWQIRTGMTKTSDGKLSFCKSLLQSQNNNTLGSVFSSSEEGLWAWDRTLGTYTKSLPESNKFIRPGQGAMNESMWENSLNASDVVPYSSEDHKMRKAEMDLSNSKYDLSFINDINMGYFPQAITKDEIGFKYISHPEANKISVVQGAKFIDYFKPALVLKCPRYVLALPRERIIILDARGFHIFNNLGVHQKSILSEEAETCRGLAYDFKYGRLLTVQKSIEGSFLLVIDVEVNDAVMKRILIKPTSDTQKHKEKTKCLFLVYLNNTVFVSDYGLGKIYIIHLCNDSNKVFCEAPKARGLTVDPSGNILVTTSNRGSIYVYSSNGKLVRTLDIPEVKEMADIYLDYSLSSIFITDTKNNSLFQYCITKQEVSLV